MKQRHRKRRLMHRIAFKMMWHPDPVGHWFFVHPTPAYDLRQPLNPTEWPMLRHGQLGRIDT